MKKLILILVFVPSLSFSQKLSIPYDSLNNDIVYTGIVTIDSVSKDQIFLRAREWFAKTYVSANSVLQMEDKEGGKLIGKGVYKYKFVNGVSVSDITLTFTLNLSIKDGKYKYELSQFSGENKNTMLLGDGSSNYTNVDYVNEYIQLKKKGTRVQYRTKLLKGLDEEANSIIKSLKEAVLSDKEDW